MFFNLGIPNRCRPTARLRPPQSQPLGVGDFTATMERFSLLG